MSLKEHNDNRFTKERDEVERYLLRIIQRYFDIEHNYTQESIEAMILESLTRFKQSIVSETGFLFSLNQMTGKLTLTIQDFNGEPVFGKNTAFNKDFGTTANTICEGNDERLYDSREPVKHVHTIDDINGLRETLEAITIPTSSFSHNHKNYEVLEVLTYTGSQAQIDLAVLEYLQRVIEEHCNKFPGYKQELKTIQNNGLEKLATYISTLKQIVLNAQELTENAITWLSDAYTYTNTSVQTWKQEVLQSLLGYITKAQGQILIDALKKSYYRVTDGEISLQDGTVSFVPIQEDDTHYHTNISESSTTTHDVSSKLQQATNGKLKLYFRYDKDGQAITTPLPFRFKSDDGDTVIQGSYTEDGLLTITTSFMNTLKLYTTDANLYDTETIIVANSVDTNIFYYLQQYTKQNGYELCKIDSAAKNAFIANIIQPDTYYYIDGERSFIDNQYYDSNAEVLTYFNWADGHPLTEDEYDSIAIINDTWESVDSSQKLGFIAEYKIKRLSQYFENPRIYYEILGNKEVV